MSDSSLPSTIVRVKQLLSPYIKTRQEAAHIRRVLSVHLDSHFEDFEEGHHGTRLIALPPDPADVKSSDQFMRGVRREYLKVLRNNIRARQGYQRLIQEYEVALSSQGHKSYHSADEPMNVYLALVRQRQKLERLRILQNHLDILGQKPAAAARFLETREVTAKVAAVPAVPEDVMTSGPINSSLLSVNLADLSSRLEKSVLQSKATLKIEKGLLAGVKSQSHGDETLEKTKVEALGRTRNVLISLIEEELSKAGTMEDDSNMEYPTTLPEGSIEESISAVKELYGRYVKAREHIIEITTPGASEPLQGLLLENPVPFHSSGPQTTRTHLPSISDFLQRLLVIAARQKSLIQQKSHLSSSLTREYKETTETLTRLAHESHLLPAYPLPDSQPQETGTDSFADAVATKNFDTISQAKAWSFAADSANIATKEAVLENVELGKIALGEAHAALEEQKQFYTSESQSPENSSPRLAYQTLSPRLRRRAATLDEEDKLKKANHGDLWSIIDGQLGMIRNNPA